MSKSLAQQKQDAKAADAGALHSQQSGITFLEEAFAVVRHHTVLNYIGDALKAARHAENILTTSIE